MITWPHVASESTGNSFPGQFLEVDREHSCTAMGPQGLGIMGSYHQQQGYYGLQHLWDMWPQARRETFAEQRLQHVGLDWCQTKMFLAMGFAELEGGCDIDGSICICKDLLKKDT